MEITQFDLMLLFAGVIKLGAFGTVIGCVVVMFLGAVRVSSVSEFVPIGIFVVINTLWGVPLMFAEPESIARFLHGVINSWVVLSILVFALLMFITPVRRLVEVIIMFGAIFISAGVSRTLGIRKKQGK